MSSRKDNCTLQTSTVTKDDEGKLVRCDDADILTCAVCHESCRAICVFQCGHYTCYACGLRIHVINKKGCPVCRVSDKEPIVTRLISAHTDFYSNKEIALMLARATRDEQLSCFVDGAHLGELMSRLYTFLCPMRKCWFHSQQDAFSEMSFLRDHMLIDHGRRYCDICLDKRAAFLCEQTLYSKAALEQHMHGRCPFDTISFTGHPRCHFCPPASNRFYDGEELLKHMQLHHYTCDICNRGQFIFTFYKNHDTLIQHYAQNHKLCQHPDCANLDPMLRVFADDVELAMHKQAKHGMKHKSILTAGVVGTGQMGSSGGGTFMPSASQLVSSAASPTLDYRNLATASNTNVEHIIFDHITSIDMEEIMPAHARHGIHRGSNRDRSHYKRGGAGQHHSSDTESRISGLPSHYYAPGTFSVLVRRTGAQSNQVHEEQERSSRAPQQEHKEKAASCASGNSSSVTKDLSFTVNLGRTADRDSVVCAPSSPLSEAEQGEESSVKVSESGESHVPTAVAGTDGGISTLSIACGPGGPLSVDEARARLRDTLARVLPSPLDLTEFNDVSHLYHKGLIKTAQFCDALHRLLPSQPAVLREVASLLLATFKSEDQRYALQSMWKMRMAPEMMQMKRAQEEQKVAEAARQAKLAASASSPAKHRAVPGSSSPQPSCCHSASGKTAKSKNAWLREPKKLLEGVVSSDGGLGTAMRSTSNNNRSNDTLASMTSSAGTAGVATTTAVWSVVTPAGVSSSELPEWRRAGALPAANVASTISQPLQSLYGGSDRAHGATDGVDFSENLYPALPRQSKPRRSNAQKPVTRSNAWGSR